MKAHSGWSSRRLESLLCESAELGYLRNVPLCSSRGGVEGVPVPASDTVRIPQFNTVCSFLRSEWLTPVLLELVTATALPLKGVDLVFAVDGTGLSTTWYDRWLDVRLAKESDRQKFVKLHAVVGVTSNVMARVAISPGHHHDNPYFRPLVLEVAKHFNVAAVVADMGYSSRANHQLGRELGVHMEIPFKSNTRPPSHDGTAWDDDLLRSLDKNDLDLVIYHLRSLVETAFSTRMRIFPAKIRTKDFVAQTNEALAGVVAYNLRVLAGAVWTRGLVIDLAKDALFLEDHVRQMVETRSCAALDRVV